MSNDFADIDNDVKTYPQEKKTQFLKLEDGHKYSIRILEPKAVKVYVHFLGGRYSIKCLGAECPVCKQTIESSVERPDTFRQEPGYSPRQKRYYVNVLDKTMVRKCVECGAEFYNLNAGICNKCSKQLGDPEPSNTVKVLSKGPQVFGQLNDYNSNILDDSGEKIGIHNFDLDLVVSGRGKETKITVIPLAHKNKPVEGEYELFDVSNPVIELNADEMLDVKRGVPLTDIFAARKAQAELDAPSVVSEELENEVQSAVNKLFVSN